MARKLFSIINVNTNKKIRFYTQVQQLTARVLSILWLLHIGSLESTLAIPNYEAMAKTTGFIHQGRCSSDVLVPEEANSSSHHPTVDPSSVVVAPSTATPSDLEDLMSQSGVPDSDILLAALNGAPPQEQYYWITVALSWFDDTIVQLLPAAIRDYAALAHVRVTPENRELLKRYFHSLSQKVEERSGDESLIQALAYVLAYLHPDIFAGDPQPLLDLGNNLLAKLNSSQRQLKQADYPSVRAILEALSQTLLLVYQVASSKSLRVRSLSQSFQNRLQEITDRVQYYPITYHARILHQTLSLLKKLKKKHKTNFRLVLPGLLGAANLVAVGQGLAIGDLHPTELQEAIRLLKNAGPQQRIEPERWYSELLNLEETMSQCLAQKDFSLYPDAAALKNLVEKIPTQRRKQSTLAAFVGFGTINQDQQALRYGICMQLSTLALGGPTPAVRIGSIEHLSALGNPSFWGSDTNVLAGLRNGLALIAAQNQEERKAEATKAQNVLKDLEKPKTRMFNQWVGLQAAKKKLSTQLQCPQGQTTQQAPSDEERLISHVRRIQRRTATTESFRVQEIANISQLSSYLLPTKVSHFVERTAITERLPQTLTEKGVCVLHGLDGSGKSTLAALYVHTREGIQSLWIDAEDSHKLQEQYQHLAQKLQVIYQPLAKKLAADDRQYRQELAKMVYDALALSNQPTLLILDNAQDASLVADYLLHRPAAIQVIITTGSAEAFEGKYDQLLLEPFSQEEGQRYLDARFKAMNRADTPQAVASLLQEVGLVPQKLNLAAGYLQANQLATTAQYIACLQDLKQAGISQPAVALNLKQLTKEGQQLMQYAAYLDAYFIPLSLVNVLLKKDSSEQLIEVASELSKRSLLQVVSTKEGKELGLQVHRQVQAFCREYQGWSSEAALGTRDTILSKLSEVLAIQMPWVALPPDDSWQRAKLYAPHVATVLTALEDAGAASSVVVLELLERMVAYSKQVGLNYHRQAERYYAAVVTMYYKYFQDEFNDLYLNRIFRNWANVWLDLGDPRRAVHLYQRAMYLHGDKKDLDHLRDSALTFQSLGAACRALENMQRTVYYYKRALDIYKQICPEHRNLPEIARIWNNLGTALSELGKIDIAVYAYNQALDIYKQICPEHRNLPEMARIWNNLGTASSELGKIDTAVYAYNQALDIYEQVYKETPNHPDKAGVLNNLGIAWQNSGNVFQALSFYQRALAIKEQVYHETPNHPAIARTLGNLGNAYCALRQTDEAIGYFKRALDIFDFRRDNDPDRVRVLIGLANTYSDLNDLCKTVTYYQKALTITEEACQDKPQPDPAIVLMLIKLGDTCRALRRTDEAIGYFERALDIFHFRRDNDPDSVRVLIALADAYSDLNDLHKAVTYYQKALTITEEACQDKRQPDPAIVLILTKLGDTWRALDEASKAEDCYQRALAINEEVRKATPNTQIQPGL